jgi:hypothetical protein
MGKRLTVGVLASLALSAGLCGQAGARRIPHREVRAASALLAREWSEEEDGVYTVGRCWRNGCNVWMPVTSYLGTPHTVIWRDWTIVLRRHGRVCAEWEGPTRGHACL